MAVVVGGGAYEDDTLGAMGAAVCIGITAALVRICGERMGDEEVVGWMSG